MSSLLAHSENKKLASHLMYHMYEKASSSAVLQNLQAPLFAWNLGSQACAPSPHQCVCSRFRLCLCNVCARVCVHTRKVIHHIPP